MKKSIYFFIKKTWSTCFLKNLIWNKIFKNVYINSHNKKKLFPDKGIDHVASTPLPYLEIRTHP